MRKPLLILFSKNLRRIIKEKKIVQIDLAKETGLRESAISQLLAAQREPRLSTIYVILKATKTKLEEFVK